MFEIDNNITLSFSNNKYDKAPLEIYLEQLELGKAKYLLKKNFPKNYRKLCKIINELETLNKDILIENYDSIIFTTNNKIFCKIYFPNNCGTSILCNIIEEKKGNNYIYGYLPLLAIMGLYFCIYKNI